MNAVTALRANRSNSGSHTTCGPIEYYSLPATALLESSVVPWSWFL